MIILSSDSTGMGTMSGESKWRALVAPPRQNTKRIPSSAATSKITSEGSKR
jgi:hypothetical protein